MVVWKVLRGLWAQGALWARVGPLSRAARADEVKLALRERGLDGFRVAWRADTRAWMFRWRMSHRHNDP